MIELIELIELLNFTTPPEIGPIYLVETALIVVGQVLTYGAFFRA